MTILNIGIKNSLIDGRQSERALSIRRGLFRALSAMGHVALPEMTLSSGRRADLMVLTDKGEIWIIEIKSSIEDFRVDKKWRDYRESCDRLFFATAPDVPIDIFPPDCGLFLSDGYDAHLLRDAPEHRLNTPKRKVITLLFARLAAQRYMRGLMQGEIDPDHEADTV